MTPQLIHNGNGTTALVTLVVGRRLTRLFRSRALPSWITYCKYFGVDLLIFDALLDVSSRAMGRSPAWQKCLVADCDILKNYKAVCWIDADIIINQVLAPSIFEFVPNGHVGAVEAWASPSAAIYKDFLSMIKQNSTSAVRDAVDDDQLGYYARFGLEGKYSTVVQTGVLVFNPNIHGSLFRKVYEIYEDRGPAWWHYEMRPLSYELHKNSTISWLDPRFNYNAICDLVVIQGKKWPNDFLLLDKLAIRMPWLPLLDLFYREKIVAIRAAMDNAWFLHFAGFRFGLVLANIA